MVSHQRRIQWPADRSLTSIAVIHWHNADAHASPDEVKSALIIPTDERAFLQSYSEMIEISIQIIFNAASVIKYRVSFVLE